MQIKFRLPNGDVFEYTCRDNAVANDFVQRICVSAMKIKMGIEPSRMSFACRNAKINPYESFKSLGITSGDTLEVLLRFDQTILPSEVCYDNFIESFEPTDGEQNVAVDIQPLFQFKENGNGLSLYISSFADRNSLPCDLDSADMDVVLGPVKASEKGFVKWTDTIYPSRIFLLEMTNPHMQELSKKMRYNIFGINDGYAGADVHSWQRYTTKPPVPCYVHVDEAAMQVRLVPEESLQYGTTYCIVLQNGMPIPPVGRVTASLFSFTGRGVCEDKIVTFRTARIKRGGRASMFDGGALSREGSI